MIRSFIATVFGLGLLLFAFLAVVTPMMLADQSREDREYYREFRATAAAIDRYNSEHGKLPNSASIPRVGRLSDIALDHMPCDDFSKTPGDEYTLGFWRGEWTECYSHPSGKTTLLRSLDEYLASGFWKEIAVLWALVIVCAVGLRLAIPRRGSAAE